MGLWFSNLTALALAAQAATIPVAGTVRDADSGAPLARVVISIPQLQREIVTGDDGRYAFDAPAGTVQVRVRRFGYVPQSFAALVPAQGALSIDIVLQREPILLAPIEVTAPAMIPANGAASFPDRRFSPNDVRLSPFAPEPDALRALGGAEVALDPESPSGLHIRGGASDQVGYLLDGIPVFSPYHTGGSFGVWNPDALASIDVVGASPLHTAPEALSGVVSAHTRAPGATFESRGTVSATQARAEINGPIGRSGAGYVASAGTAFPGLVLHNTEASHLNGNNVDWLAKVETPLWGGGARIVGYGSRTDLDVSAVPEGADTVPVAAPRHALGWNGVSAGGEWSRPLSQRIAFLLRGWTAHGDANVAWAGGDAVERLGSTRADHGVVATLDVVALGGLSTFGVRAQRIETAYTLDSDTSAAFSRQQITPVTTAFAEHHRRLSATVNLDASLAAAYATAETYLGPAAQLSWRAGHSIVLSGSVARRHQFAQSLRNTESVVSNVFPADLYLAAGGVPVATSDIAIVAAEHRPRPWLRVGAQGYARDFAGLALVAPREAGPYSSTGFTTGDGVAHGVSLETEAASEHVLVLASYAYQRVRLEYSRDDYAPNYGTSHAVQAGFVFTPSRNYTFRLGFQGLMGRRTTATLGSLEWESCNLIDGGCEFAGNPAAWSGDLGGTELPSYFRLDLGVRREWDVSLAGYGGRMGLFGTASNLLGRRNVMTVTVDPATGRRSNVDMVPISPLVVGIDWHF